MNIFQPQPDDTDVVKDARRKILSGTITLIFVAFLGILTLFSWLIFSELKTETALLTESQVIDYVSNLPRLDEPVEKGKKLFHANCAACHNKNMKDDMTGPALSGVIDRWAAFPEKDLYAFIRNSQKLINQKHPRAKEIWKAWQPNIMNSFENLSDEEIAAILAYVEVVYYDIQ